ncbi:hypothetical protein EVU94_05765 [Flavobacteriaceae bacterium 144Ye]|nr:hypothetical protein EVU94_05765 [Flavobacteriaceae bacterium 144Ye]
MKLVSPSFNVCEEILDYLNLFEKTNSITEKKIIDAIDKTPFYVKKALNFLTYVGVIEIIGNHLSLKQAYKDHLINGGTIEGVIKISITNNSVFRDYNRILNNGKNQKQSATYVISTLKLDIDSSKFISVMNSWAKYLEKEDRATAKTKTESKKMSFMWVDEMGNLMYDEKKHTDFIIDQVKKDNKSLGEGLIFVDPDRINQLQKIGKDKFDLSKLIRKCEELNIAYSTKSYFSVGMLTRAITDHIPPIFNKKSFSEVAGGYGTKSFKDSMIHLDKSSRKIADSFLHTHIRRKETLPTRTQVNFSSDLDVLLGEIIRILN